MRKRGLLSCLVLGVPCWEAGDEPLGPWVYTSETAPKIRPCRETEGL